MPDDAPTTPSDRGSRHVDRWVTDTWEVFFMLFQPKNQAGQGGQGPNAT